MIRVSIFVLVVLAALGLAGRQFSIYWGWQPLHANEFASDDCALYHIMRGMEQDPAKDPANAGLMQKCGPDYIPWSLSQTGDLLRFDRPARIRMRFDPIDMQRYSNYPPMLVEFVYPPVDLPATFRVRQWGSPFAAGPEASAKLLRAHWAPPWAELFARWSLGRGGHEVWLGGATIEDPKYCERIEHDDQRKEDFCRMTLINARTQAPIEIKLPLKRRMEIRLEMLEICRFGGQVRRWENPLLVKIFGATEYTDRGCGKF
jgi:hypothetical protein